MSESIPVQWISQYIIKVAETCGKSFTDVPLEAISPSKKKRVQILEFLTYNPDAAIWGRVSDKEYSIPVCFTKDAVLQYMKDLQGRRLTEAKHAVFVIGQFRPIFVRIPVGNNRSNFSEVPHIALEAGVVKFVGSGLGVFGSPQDVEMNSRVKAWVRGLRQGGNGGDVLKRVQQNAGDSQPKEICPAINHVEAPPMLQAREPERNSPHISPERPLRTADLMREYRKRWAHIENLEDIWTATIDPCDGDEMQTLAGVQPQMGQLPVEECVPPDTVVVVARSQPCTPPRTCTRTPEQDIDEQTTPRTSEWPSSAPGSPTGVLPSPARDGDDDLPNHCVNAGASPEENDSLHEPSIPPATSPLRPPTPAQRIRRPSLHPSPSDSSPIPAPPSSFTTHIRRNIKRRVPHPGVPLLPADHSGPTQILVPNSDTSGTQSQSQSQPQSEPSSQLFSQSQSHRPAFPSQLTQEFKPGPTSTPAAVKQSLSGTDRGASLMPPGDQLGHWGGDRASSPGVINWDVHESPGHGDHRPSDTNPDAHQVLQQSTTEDPDTMDVDPVDGIEIPAAVHTTPSQAPGDPLDRHKPMRDTSPQPSDSSMHSLFSGSPSFSLSQSEVIPSIVPRTISGEPTSQAPSHNAEAWKAPSFMSSRKGKGKAIEVLDKTSGIYKRRRASPTFSSPLASHKRGKNVVDETEPGPARPVNEDERAISTVKSNHAVTLDIRQSHEETPNIRQSSSRRISKDLSQVRDALLSQSIDKKRRIRLMGYQVDFENIPVKAESSSPMLSLGRLHSILLRTGRVRTLGDVVTRDGSIFMKSD
ncbi:uncharacterized protein F5891DRAFT_1175555 [Suillus fuscotomentosus]|uniref:Shelterin complex subunit TPP1/Est3 domain-containing protein n=1 Tax=Suillus fuscotomentosus TaxID=1912939 RepID=A0AAD4DWS2_9AGAM|nr:uncharacterized protein F5891DRAFT_1175555 [Suillus fuscotomentosus]KAG1895510.1 hypothetical protein F5891DRAFT_1175555 [Suillus fuscotomentosus]